MAQARPELVRIDPDRDADALADLHSRNREFMEPYEPNRDRSFFEAEGIRQATRKAQREHGNRMVDWLIMEEGDLVGVVTLSNIARGAFQSCNLGYSVDQRHNGRGIATAAVGLALDYAFDELGLHRVEAGTLTTNLGSMKVLRNNDFHEIGVSPYHIHIGGSWQDHVLFAKTEEMHFP